MKYKYWRICFKTSNEVGYAYRWIEARNNKGFTEKEVAKWAKAQLAAVPDYVSVDEIVKEDK